LSPQWLDNEQLAFSIRDFSLGRVTVHGHGRAPVNRLSGHTGPVTKGPRIVAGQNTPLPAVPAIC